MTKKLDPDVKVLRACVRALEQSSSPRMLRANMEYLYDKFVRKYWRDEQPRPKQ